MRVFRLACVLPALLIVFGCSSVSAKGRILGAGGMPITDARASVRVDDSGPALESAAADQNGCFDVFIVSAPPGQQRFTLEVRAPGRKAVTLEFERKARDPFLVTLADESGDGTSGIRAVAPEKKNNEYDLYCVPVAVPGATSLGLR